MWVRAVSGLRVLGLLIATLAVAGGCGKTADTGSGETHFVVCDVDADCDDVVGAHTCSGGYCRGPANEPGGGSGATDTGGSSSVADELACGSGCAASECGIQGTCSLRSACQLVSCDSDLFDANACLRPTCENDTDCPDDERCVSTWWSKHYECVQHGDSCDCTNGLGLFPVKVCSQVSLAGARGAWQSISVNEIVIGVPTRRTFTVDGHVSIEQPNSDPADSSAELSSTDLDELTRLIDGPNLRHELADPTECAVTKSLDILVDLELDTTTLSKNVAGCRDGAHPGIQQLVDLTERY